jgi:hypothetical protein
MSADMKAKADEMVKASAKREFDARKATISARPSRFVAR